MTLTLRQGPGDGAGPVDTWTQRPIDMGRLLIILWHRKWLMALCFGAAIAVAQAMLSNMPKTYTAHAEVMLNNRETTVVDIETVVSELGGLDASTNEERVLTSEALLQRVVDRLRLDLDPEFNRSLAPASLLSDWKGAVNAALSDGPLAPVLVAAPDVPDPALSREHRRVAIVGAVRARLKVEAIPKTRAISIEVTSTDPAKAALIANTLADLYIVDQLDAKFESTRRASAWLADRMSALKNKVEASEAAVEA
ncbi:MAG: Wzz/FepE/Etk N-terminal domain-containing protein, partial [Pseudomonadota bacterium]